MSSKEDQFLAALRATFQVEAAEHLQVMATGLLNLEKTPSTEERSQLVDVIFRAAHSLKGAARATDFTDVESLCQSLEDMFAIWKRGESAPSRATLDRGHHLLNTITAALLSPGASPSPREPVPIPAFAPPRLAAIPLSPQNASDVGPARVPEGKSTSSAETVRISVAKLDARLVQAEEMLAVKLTAGQRAAGLRELTQNIAAWKSGRALVEQETHAFREASAFPSPGHTGIASAAGLSRMTEFLDWDRAQMKTIESKVAALARTADQDRHVIGKLVDDLLEDSKRLLLVPFATLAAPFPKLVRDLCRDQGKEADLVIHGEDVEVDRRILEEMKDPLIHLLRNSVDHGIETPAQRSRAGKSPRATITLAVSPVNGSKVEFLLSDDGAGIDPTKVKDSAIKHGYLSPTNANRLDDAAACALIFQAEVSTSPLITRLSGRGLGLAIVREQAEKLGGTVVVENQPGRGARFRIRLPSTLATFRGVLIEAAQRRFVVPTLQVERVARVKTSEVRTAEGREILPWDGRAVALVRLAQVLELPPAGAGATPPPLMPILILGLGEQRIALAVDAILDEQEVLVKSLRKPLLRVRNITGATVLGSGEVVPILNIADLLKSARNAGTGTPLPVVATKPPQAQRVLVAEDSITSRTLIKSILESAGYQVRTAVDGMEAFTLLRAEKFDLVVSDVEMPRLSGFDLTARIRADRGLGDLPVILITALETRADRERGIDVGASAYLIKSRFDQSDLLDTIRRLI